MLKNFSKTLIKKILKHLFAQFLKNKMMKFLITIQKKLIFRKIPKTCFFSNR